LISTVYELCQTTLRFWIAARSAKAWDRGRPHISPWFATIPELNDQLRGRDASRACYEIHSVAVDGIEATQHQGFMDASPPQRFGW
jgi:hypothetical protein